MKEPLAKDDQLLRFIPQRPPIVMIDKLWSNEEKSTVSGLEVTAGNVFSENGKLREPGLVENIAQTAAARVGHYYAEKSDGNSEPPVGFIAAVKDLKIEGLPNVGNELKTEVIVKNEVMNVTIIQGAVHCDGRLLATCEMKIFLREE